MTSPEPIPGDRSFWADDGPSSSFRRRRLTTGLFVFILLLAAALRFYQLGTQSFWNDEGTTIAMALRDAPTIARDAAHDIHPPLYYWLMSGWVRLAGPSEAAARAPSALLGVALVATTYSVGLRLAGREAALLASLLAAVNPFQVYYSQEARMYMLAAVLASVAILALVVHIQRRSWLALVVLVLAEAAGLYTHYSFAFVILVLNLSFGLWLFVRPRGPDAERPPMRRAALIWAASQAVVLLLYLPWAPIGLRQITTWPNLASSSRLLPALARTWSWLVFGPTGAGFQSLAPLLLTAAAACVGVVALLAPIRRSIPYKLWRAGVLVLWLGLPLTLVFALGLFREAYLKFLLVTAPAVSLLLSCGLLAPLSDTLLGARPSAGPTPPGGGLESTNGPTHCPAETKGSHANCETKPITRYTRHAPRPGLYTLRLFQLATLVTLVVGSILALQTYYTDPAAARDDYRAIAAYIQAVGRQSDSILLNAPGQQEVWSYYFHGDLPVYPLPEQRPLDPTATEAALADMARPGSRIFALLWATDESDPERFVEGWLDSHAYKAVDSWYGNVRLVEYAVPEMLATEPQRAVEIPFRHSSNGDEIALVGYSLLAPRLAAGEIAPVTLFWRAAQPPVRRYKVFVHVLDGADHIVGQRDAEPGGGAVLTTLWAPGQVVVDNLGIPIHPATPPGEYRIEVGLYDAETGDRLAAPDGAAQTWLDPLQVERPAAAAPVEALGMQVLADADFGDLTLLGYDAHLLGSVPPPELPLHPGDALHVNFYWRANSTPVTENPGKDWHVLLSLVDSDGREWASVSGAPVGNFPTSLWQKGDIWQGQFNLTLPADVPAGDYRLQVLPQAPDGSYVEPYLSKPLSVAP